MESAGGETIRMLPLWVRFGKMDNRLARMESWLDNSVGTEQDAPPQ